MENNKETIILGDFNFDAKSISKNESQKSNYEKNFNKMYITVKNYLYTKNAIQIIKNNTRDNKILDHVYTNNINKIKYINVNDDMASDHAKITIIRSMNIEKI